MRRRFVPGLIVLSCLAISPALAQNTFLNQVEQRVQNPAGGAAGAATATPGYLGAVFGEDDVDATRGVPVDLVKPGTPAATAGLKKGDYVSAIDGKPTLNWAQFVAILDSTKPGQKVELTIERGGQKQQLSATLGSLPKPAPTDAGAGAATPSLGAPTTPPGTTTPPPSTSPSLLPSTSPSFSPGIGAPPATESPARPGISAAPLNLGAPPTETPGSAVQGGGFGAMPGVTRGKASLGIKVLPSDEGKKAEFGFPVNRGAFVAAVNPGSPAEAAGLPPNSLIVQMNGRAIESDEDLIRAVGASPPGMEVELSFYVGSKLDKKAVRLGTAAASSAPVSPSLAGVEPPGTTVPPGPSFGATGVPGAGSYPTGESPLRLGGAPPGGGLLNRVERLAGNVARAAQGGPAGGGGLPPVGRSASTVYDPLQMADLQKAVADLQQRLSAIEAKLGITSGSQHPAPGFGSPSGTGTNP